MKLKKRHRRKFYSRQTFYFIIVFFLMVCLGVGYSVVTSNISLKGNAAIAKNTWNVRFENYKFSSSSTATSTSLTATSNYTILNFSGTLNNVGNQLIITTNITNKGTLNAKLSKVTLSGLTTEQKKYLSYTATYSSGTALSENDALNAGKSESIKIIVYYYSSSARFETDQSINLSLSLDYVQGNGNPVQHISYSSFFAGKKTIIIGDRDGITGDAIETTVKTAGAEVIYKTTECFYCTAAGAMNRENQQVIKDSAEKYGAENLIIILGASDGESAGLAAETAYYGDPTFAGPLTGVSLYIPSYHVVEPEIKEIVDSNVYNELIGPIEAQLKVNDIINELAEFK